MSRSGAQARLAERRAYAGAMASAASPKRKWPLRKIVEEVLVDGRRRQVLECGHLIGIPHDMIGETYPARRRCGECYREAQETES